MAEDLVGQRILVTSGPTRAHIDAVRYISNRSSGRLGRAITLEALGRGAHVTLVAGPESVIPERNNLTKDDRERLRVLHIETVTDLLQVLQEELTARPRQNAVVHAMAVLDYVPLHQERGKVASGKNKWTLKLTPTPKVIRKIKEWSPRTFLVGFKLEVDKNVEKLQSIGTSLMRESRADVVVANDLSRIRGERHPALILGTAGNLLASPQTKTEIARELCRVLARALD